jgi:hypothetical protein
MKLTNRKIQSKFLIDIGSKLKTLRLLQNIQVETAAKSLRMSSKRLQLIELGEVDIRVDVFVGLCNLYQANVNDVLP